MAQSRPYALALLATLVALGLALATSPIDPDDSVAALLFLAAVGVSAWRWGLWPAVVPTVGGGLALDYFFEIPRYELQISSSRTLLDLGSFIIVAVLVGTLNHQLRQAYVRLRMEHARVELERDRAEMAVRARDELLVTVSHTLRTPLTTIQTSIFCLRDAIVELPPTRRAELLARVGSEVDRLIRFVSDALELSRLENAPVTRLESNDLGDVVWSALDRCRTVLDGRSIEFAMPDDLPLGRFDAGLLDLAVVAVLENAATHTPPGSPVSIHGAAEGKALRLAIDDAGPGIPPVDRERIFAKYERVANRGHGVGLGLAIARAAMQAQGGRLWVEESPRRGARFVFILPEAIGARRSESAASVSEPDSAWARPIVRTS